jgi:hypothetical protein
MDQHGVRTARNTLIVALAAALLGALGMALYAGLSGAGADDGGKPHAKCFHRELSATPPEVRNAPPPDVKDAPPPKVIKKMIRPKGAPAPDERSLETGCGPEPGLMLRARKVTPEQQREMRKKAEKHAQCMREHGVDVGPVEEGPGGGVAIRLPDGFDPTGSGAKRAEKACEDHLPKPPPPPAP